MNRRQFLSRALPAVSITLAGCAQGDSNDETETSTPRPDGTAPGCWPSMCEGTQLIEVDISSSFSGSAVLEPSCRSDTLELEAGESVQLRRESDGEECGVTLFIDDEQAYSEYIEGHVSVTVTVESDGAIDEERVML